MTARPEQLQNAEIQIDEPADQPEADEEVTIIVELQTEPQLSTADHNGGPVIQNRELLIRQQSAAQKQISTKVLDGKPLEILHSYTVVTNGFAAVVPYGKLDEIRALPEVAAAYLAPVFKVAPDMQSSGNVVGGMENASGYNGEGQVIAIIDSGLQVDHKSFAAAPSTPAMTKDTVTASFAQNELQAEESVPGLTASQVYRSAKVPFAFDYADDDIDVAPGSAGDHGTHVAGIAAANAGVVADVVGVAPQAQILAMKVFSSGGSNGATWDDILAAMDDAVYLGADVMNMSLGSVCGFSTPEGDEGVETVLQRVSSAGVMLSVAAGNEYSAAFYNKIGKSHALTQNPDYGTVASPSSYEASMAVASVEKAGTIQSSYFTVGERKVAYNDTAEADDVTGVPETAPTFKSLGTTAKDFVLVPNNGETADYEGLDMAGKIALVSRGGINYEEKKNNAKTAGAAAMLVYNNEPGMQYMQFDTYDLPSAFISQADGTYLASLVGDARKLTISASSGEVDNPTSGQMSDFSSWGVTPELTLKPDITAPGGNIKSTTTDGGYTTKSGTSMAAPFVAGAMSVVKQYLEKEHAGEAGTEAEKVALTDAVLMSTADIMRTDGTPYSPRKQGAGCVDVTNAVKSPAYLTVDGKERPKIELGDDVSKSGKYDMSFKVHNYSETEVTYTLGGTIQTDGAEITKQYMGKDVWQNTELPYLLEAKVPAQTVSLAAGETITVNTTVTLTAADKSYMDEHFANGAYVEGFLTLTPATNGVVLSLPYMGFYGDWTKASVIDRGYYWNDLNKEENWASQYTNTAGVTSLEGTVDTALGDNPYHTDVPYLQDRNAISPNSDDTMDKLDLLYTGLLRNVRTLTYTIADASNANNVYYTKTVDYEIKSVYDSARYRIVPSGVADYSAMDPWAGTGANKMTLPNDSKATVTVSCTLPYDKHAVNNECLSWSFPITVDTEEPQASDITTREENGKFFVDLTVSDNQYVSNVLFADASGQKELGSYSVAETEAGKSTQLSYNVTGYGENLTVVVNDYAGNRKEYKVKVEGNVDDSEVIVPTKAIMTQNFESTDFPGNDWTLQSTAAKTWYQGTEFGSKMAMCDYSTTQQQNEKLVSPVVDLSAQSTRASMVFDYYTNYYWSVQQHNHNLKVLASADGGENWDTLWQLWDVQKEFSPWEKTQAKVAIPEKFQDAAAVQFAFVYEGQNGTSVYMDNIQLYVDDPLTTHTITASAGTGGSITPSGKVSVSDGKSRSFAITPEENYFITDVKVDGASVGAKNSYAFTNVTADHTIEATFSPTTGGDKTILLEENFDELSAGSTLPADWTLNQTNANATWKIYEYVGSLAAYCTADYDSDTETGAKQDERLILPATDMANGGGTASFTFTSGKYMIDNKTFGLTLEGSIDGKTWTEIWSYADVPSADYTKVTDYIEKADVSVAIPDNLQTGTTQLSFRYTRPAGENTGSCSVDNIRVQANAGGGTGGDEALLDEDFNGRETGGAGWLPENWTVQSKNTSYTWETKKYSDQWLAACSADTYDSDYGGWSSELGYAASGAQQPMSGNYTQDERLVTPALALNGKTGTVGFQFSAVANMIKRGEMICTLQGSTDGGATWTQELWDAKSAVDQMQPGVLASNVQTADITVEIPAEMQKDNAKFAFRYQRTKSYSADGGPVEIDNVKVLTKGGTPTPPATETFDITVTDSIGGTISPRGTVKVNKGESKTFAIAASSGYALTDVLVDGKSVGAVTAYTFNNVQAAHTISAVFTKNAEVLPTSLEENFNNSDGIPTGWSVEGISTAYETWKIGPYEALGRTNAALCTQNFMGSQTQDEKFILPRVNLTGSSVLTFDFGGTYEELLGNTFQLTVQASSDKGATWTELWNAKDHVTAAGEDETAPEDIIGKGIVAIPANYCNADAQFAFVFTSSTRRNGTAAIDNVTLGGSSAPAPSLYAVSVAAMAHGSVTPSKMLASEGDVITLTVTPDAGYHLKSGSLMAGDEMVTNNQFTMPGKAVQISAIFDADETPAVAYKDGTYRGSGYGHSKTPIVVDVIVEKGVVSKVDIVSQDETGSYWSNAIAILQNLLGLGSNDAIGGVDTVSGATESSTGIKAAVLNALEKATNEDSGIFDAGDGTEKNPYIIATLQQLQDFAAAVNGGESYEGVYISLGGSLSAEGVTSTPIGYADHDKYTGFSGVFDGQSYTVSKLTCGTGSDAADYEAAGFFGVVADGGVVKNLNLKIEKIYNSHETAGVTVSTGGIAGILGRGAMIDHCTVTGGQNAISEASARNTNVGGVVGRMLSGSTISNTWSDVGLSFGTLSMDALTVAMGGICGTQVQDSLIANSASFGSVPGMIYTGTMYMGGLAGKTGGAIYNCYTTSTVKANRMETPTADLATTLATTALGHLIGCSDTGAALYQCYYNEQADQFNNSDMAGDPSEGKTERRKAAGVDPVSKTETDLTFVSAEKTADLATAAFASAMNEGTKNATETSASTYFAAKNLLTRSIATVEDALDGGFYSWELTGGRVLPQGTQLADLAVTAVDLQVAKHVPFGTAQAEIGLPATVQVTLDNGKKSTVSVAWSCAQYNAQKPGVYTFEGALTMVSGITNPEGLKAYLEVTVENGSAAETYAVAVTGGTGAGSYASGAQVTVTANAAASGQQFDGWTVSGIMIADLTKTSITFTMPANAVTITAKWKTIGGGSGGSGGGGGGNSGGQTTTNGSVISPSTAVQGDAATATVTNKEISSAIDAAKKTGADVILIEPEVTSGAKTLTVTLSKTAAQSIVTDTDAALLVKTDKGTVNIPHDTLRAICEQAKGSDLKITVSAKSTDEVKGYVGDDVDLTGAVAVAVTVQSGITAITDFGGKSLTISIPAGSKHVEGESYKVIVISDSGKISVMTGKCVKTDGKLFIQVATDHLSTFVATVATIEKAMPFADVNEHWAFDAISYAYDNSLMNGTSDTVFTPDGTLNRAMLTTILYRMAGEPAVTASNPFTDVKTGEWYTNAVIWASENKIVSGVGDGKFEPDADITREQMATMLYNYAVYKDYDVTAGGMAIREFSDYADIADWAVTGMTWANNEGLLTGRTATTIAPAGTATRAEAATILMRFSQKNVK